MLMLNINGSPSPSAGPPNTSCFLVTANTSSFFQVLDQVKMRWLALPDQAIRTLDVPQDAQINQQLVETLRYLAGRNKTKLKSV